MNDTLTAGQRALLEAALVRRQHQLDQQLAARQQGLSRAEHAHDVLLQDGDDAPQRDGERAVDMALVDREGLALGEVGAALQRLAGGHYGRCSDCDADIPFDRLKAEPWAQRCVVCEGRRERGAP